MDIRTLTLVDAILAEKGLRAVARNFGLSSSTVSAALTRFESAMATPLFKREGQIIVPTLEAKRRAHLLGTICQSIRALTRTSLGEARLPPFVTIECLRRFLVATEKGSIRAAARHVGIGQPQLTRQLSELERALGEVLFLRTASGAALTAAGLQMQPLIEAIVEGWLALSSAASEKFSRDVRGWRIGTGMPLGHESSIAHMLANLTALWAHRHNQHSLFISNHSTDQLLAGIKNRRFDLVVVDRTKIPDELSWQEILTTPLTLVGHPDVMPLDAAPRDLLRSSRIALPGLENGLRQEAMRYIERTVGAQAATKLSLVEIDSFPVIINLVANHGYLSILPEVLLNRLPFNLRRINLAPDHMQRLVMVWNRNVVPEELLYAVKRAISSEH